MCFLFSDNPACKHATHFHTDVQSMTNTVRGAGSTLCFQLCIIVWRAQQRLVNYVQVDLTVWLHIYVQEGGIAKSILLLSLKRGYTMILTAHILPEALCAAGAKLCFVNWSRSLLDLASIQK